jgi:hypothetical protein
MGEKLMRIGFAAKLDRYFFQQRNLVLLGVLRIALMLRVVHHVFASRGVELEYSALNQLHQRSLLIDFLSKTFFFDLPSSVFSIIFIAAAMGTLFGIFTRLSLFVFGIFLMYATGFSASLGVFDHENCLVSQLLVAMAFIPGVTNLSVDRLVKYFLKYRKGEHFRLYEAFFQVKESVWGLRLLLILLACVYFTAGFSKVRFGGLKWMDGKTLTFYLDGHASPAKQGRIPPMFLSSQDVKPVETWKDGFGLYSYSYGNRQYSSVGRKAAEFVSSIPPLIMALAIVTVLFELSSFLIFLDGWPRTIYLLCAIMLHVSISLFMNLDFVSYRIADFLLIDWIWVFRQVPALIPNKVHGRFAQVREFFTQPVNRLDKELA